METPQHGNASNKSGNPSKTGFFETFLQFLQEKTEIPENPVFEGFPLYFEAFPKIFERFPLFT